MLKSITVRAMAIIRIMGANGDDDWLTKLLLDDFQNFLLIEFLWKSLNGSQGLAAISFCLSLELGLRWILIERYGGK